MLSFISFWNYIDICSQDTKLFKDNWKVNTGTLIFLGFMGISRFGFNFLGFGFDLYFDLDLDFSFDFKIGSGG